MRRLLLLVLPVGSLVGGAIGSLPAGAVVGYVGASVAVTIAATLIVWGLRLEACGNRAAGAPLSR